MTLSEQDVARLKAAADFGHKYGRTWISVAPATILALLAEHREIQSRARGNDDLSVFHGKPCAYCGEPVNVLAANPDHWQCSVAVAGDAGVLQPRHWGCVSSRLVHAENATADLRAVQGERDELRQRLDELFDLSRGSQP